MSTPIIEYVLVCMDCWQPKLVGGPTTQWKDIHRDKDRHIKIWEHIPHVNLYIYGRPIENENQEAKQSVDAARALAEGTGKT